MWVFLSELCGPSFSFSPTDLAPTDGYFRLVNALENGFNPTLFKLYEKRVLNPDRQVKYGRKTAWYQPFFSELGSDECQLWLY